MGQYFKCINIDRGEYIEPLDYNNGMKLMEHSYIGNNYVGAVEALLSPGERWHKTRITWAGDYMEEDLFLDAFEGSEGSTLYDYADDAFTNLGGSIEVKPIRFVVNHTKKQYVDRSKIVLRYGLRLTVNPLPLLTSSGNGQGGGDYFSETHADLVGVWAADVISTDNDKPDGYTELSVYFAE